MGFTSDAWDPIVGKPSRSEGSQRQAKNLRLKGGSRHQRGGQFWEVQGEDLGGGETRFSHAWLTLKGRRIHVTSRFIAARISLVPSLALFRVR